LNLCKEERLILLDAKNGSSFAYVENIAKTYRTKYPDKHIILCIDSFHKLPDISELQGQERIKRLSNRVKNSATANKISIIAVAEYRKLLPGMEPDNDSLADSRSLSYDADVVIHLYNELHHKDEETAVLIHKDKYGSILPRIKCKFGKNKIAGYEGREFLDFYPASGQYRAVSLEAACKEQQTRCAELDEKGIKYK